MAIFFYKAKYNIPGQGVAKRTGLAELKGDVTLKKVDSLITRIQRDIAKTQEEKYSVEMESDKIFITHFNRLD